MSAPESAWRYAPLTKLKGSARNTALELQTASVGLAAYRRQQDDLVATARAQGLSWGSISVLVGLSDRACAARWGGK